MRTPRSRLPPLNGLRAFEAAARHCSFKLAAEELNVTPAAVSQQVRQIEEFCGVQLFRRLPRTLALTQAGQKALPLLTQGLDAMGEAYDAIRRSREDRSLVVTAPPSFSIKWLIPRLPGFQTAFPDIDVHIDATDELTGFEDARVDIGIRYGAGTYRGLVSELLMKDCFFPVCSPGLVAPDPVPRDPGILRRHRLIHVDWPSLSEAAPDWAMWLKAADIEHPDMRQGYRCTSESMALDAAVSGAGIALVSSTVAQSELKSGRVMRLFASISPRESSFAYYLVYPRSQPMGGKAQAFHGWLQGEIAAFMAEIG